MDFSDEYYLEDPSGNEHFFLPYDTSMYTDISEIKKKDNISETIEEITQDEYKKFNFMISSQKKNLYTSLSEKFENEKDSIIDNFKNTDVFIDSLDLLTSISNPLDYRSLLNENKIKDVDQNEFYESLDIDFKDFNKKIQSIKSKGIENYNRLLELEVLVKDYLGKLDTESKKILSIIDIFDNVEDDDFNERFRNIIIEGTEKLYMDKNLKPLIIEYKKKIQNHLLFINHLIQYLQHNYQCNLLLIVLFGSHDLLQCK